VKRPWSSPRWVTEISRTIRRRRRIRQGDLHRAAAALARPRPARVIHQNLPHHLRRQREEAVAIFEV